MFSPKSLEDNRPQAHLQHSIPTKTLQGNKLSVSSFLAQTRVREVGDSLVSSAQMGLKSSKLADLYWKQAHLTIPFAGQKYIYLRIPIRSSRKRCMCPRNAESIPPILHQHQPPMKQRIQQKGGTVTTSMDLLFTLFHMVHIMIQHLTCFLEAFPSA